MAAIQKEVSKVGGVDGVEKRQDQLEDLLADASDVIGAGNRVMGDVADLDDDELLEELEQMELKDLTDQLTGVGTSAGGSSSSDPVFAKAPTTKPMSAREREKEREERELLEELKSSMAMKVEAPMPMPMMAACY